MNLPTYAFADPADVTAKVATLAGEGHGDEARRAFGVLAGLLRTLDATDLGRLGLLNSRNHARLVRTSGGDTAVLKLTVVTPGDEIGALSAWQGAGLAGTLTPAVYAAGTTDEGYQWSLQQRLPGDKRQVADGADIAEAALALTSLLHLPGVNLPPVATHLERQLHRARNAGHPKLAAVATVLTAQLNQIVWDPPVLLHGDFAANNILTDGAALRVIDPAGLCGPAAYDTARFLARSTSTVAVAPRTVATAEHSGLDASTLAVLTGCELAEVARWALVCDITGRGVDALVADMVALARLAS
jgi:hypothetical protein